MTLAPKFTCGYQPFEWHDDERACPVRATAWFPAPLTFDEQPIDYGLGAGAVVPGASISSEGERFPIVVLSHGAFGAPANYAWLAEYLARRGVVVLGVAHYGESWVYGPETIDAAAATRLWERPRDCSFALTCFLAEDTFATRLDAARIAAIGHSSGGATAVALAGARLDPQALAAYCSSDAGAMDHGCDYARTAPVEAFPPEATASYADPRVSAIVLLDPAAGPGYSAESLAAIDVPTLVIGSQDNDFLPFSHHAGPLRAAHPQRRAAFASPNGEGHFVYLNACASDIAANGVPLCIDRAGVSRQAVHERLAPDVLRFLQRTIGAPA